MYTSTRDKESISFTLSSDLALIHQVVRETEAFLHEYGANDTVRTAVVLGELLSNAIWHGNENIETRTVHCRVEHTARDEFTITVEDEGEGFDFASLDTSLPDDPRGIHKRGYVLIRNICRAIEFNPTGNRVTVLMHVPEAGRPQSQSGSPRTTATRVSVRPSARYGIDVRGYSFHAEADDLHAILLQIEPLQGMVSVVDRHNQGRVLIGTADEVRDTILSLLAGQQKNAGAGGAGSDFARPWNRKESAAAPDPHPFERAPAGRTSAEHSGVPG